MNGRRALTSGLLLFLAAFTFTPGFARPEERKIAEMELLLLGVSATVDPVNPVIPKNTDAGVRIVLKAGDRELSLPEATAFFGAPFWVEGELAGPALEKTETLSSKSAGPAPPADPLLLPIPGITTSGDYELNNLRVMVGGRPVLEVQPQHVPVKVIEQVLVTSVKTRPLTLDEIRAMGIVLDSDDYYAFEFTLGLKLESTVVDIKFPVAFDHQGVPIPQYLLPPPSPTRQADVQLPPLPTIVPVLFEFDPGDGPPGPGERLPTLPGGGGEVRIPSVIVIPGNVGYLNQFFSAKLFVANGAPVGSGLSLKEVAGTIKLPPGDGPGTDDDPLWFAKLERDGHKITQPETMPVRGVGPDGEAGTADDVESLRPGEQGEAEFFVVGKHEGFHTIDFDIRAVLEGLVTGPVRIRGKAKGPVLVRNPYFDVSFTVPGVIRTGEKFKVFVTLTNLSDVPANSVSLTLPETGVSGATFVGQLPPAFPTIAAREAKVFDLTFRAERTGQVVASYLKFEPEGEQRPVGRLELAVGIGERGVPLSPDTLVLPAAVDQLPAGVVEASMRVLGQAWSIANAPSGTLPRDVIRTNRTVVTQKALALAEAGLRLSLGQRKIDALRDVAFDLWGGQPLDPGFDQLLRTTEAGRELRVAIGAALADDPLFPGALELEEDLAEVAASGPDFASFAVSGGDQASPLGIALRDAGGRETSSFGPGASEVEGGALLPLGGDPDSPVLGIVAAAADGPYALEIRSAVDTTANVSMTLPAGDGTFVHAEFHGVTFLPGQTVHVTQDPLRPGEIVLQKDGQSPTRAGGALYAHGPRLVSATVIGPETLQGASPFGFQLVALFDRVVDAASAAQKGSYEIPRNAIQGARRQLSGRLVFVSLAQPEGPHVRTSFSVDGLSDPRGNQGPSGRADVRSRLEDPGAVVRGRVFQADGTPVGKGTVTYVNNSNVSCTPSPIEAGFAAFALDAEGHYEFRYVRQDNCGTPFKVVTQDPATGARRQASAYVRADGEVITLDLALLGGGAVEGTVRNLRGVVPGARVVAYSQTDPQVAGVATTDGLGHYLIDGITVGPIVVKAGKDTALGSKPGRIDHAGTTTTVDVFLDGEAARVFGTVQQLEDGESTAVIGVPVLFKHFDAASPYGLLLGVAVTDVDGAYVFDGVPAGQFEVSAALNTRDRDLKTGVAVAGMPVQRDLLIVIPKPAELATVNGQVFMPDGQTPATDVVVSVGGRGVVSTDGSFTIPGVAVKAAAQTVIAQSSDGRRSGSTTVVANEPRLYDQLRIVLSGLGDAAFRVLDEKGQPVKGQRVGLLGQCGDPCGCAAAITDSDGVAVFRDLSHGHFYGKAVRSTATFSDVATGSLAVVADDTTVLTTMRFSGAGRVQGTIRDASGAPVHGADVTLWSQRFVNDGVQKCGLEFGYAGGTRTGLDGRYAFAGINLGQVSVSARQDFFGDGTFGSKGVLSEPGQTLVLDVVFEDTSAGVLSGNVFLPGGAPAGAGVVVAVEGPLPEIKVTTDAEGHYEFRPILPEGYYTLTARDPVGGGLARAKVTLKRQEPLTRDVQLKGRGTVVVQVVSGLDDAPVESALVKLTEVEYPARTFDQSVRAGNQGTVLFLDVYEGPLKIEVSDPFARSGSATAALPGPGQEISVRVKLTPTGRVTGHFLMPDRTAIPYGTVTLKAGGKTIGQTTAQGTGDVGRYSFDYVPVGPVTLDAQDPLTGRVGFKSGALDHEGDPPLELDVFAQGLGRVHGTVTRGESPQALARVAISSGAYRSTTLTDGEGRYDVDGVPEGRVTVTASLDDQGFLAGSSSAALEGDGQSVQIDVALRDAGSVTGGIVPASEEDRAAGRFPAAIVRLSVGGTGGGSQETSTRPDGSFSFDIVPAGRVSFTADVADSIDHGSATLDVAAGANTVSIPLQGVGRLKGMAVESEDEGAPGVDGWISFSGPAFPSGTTVSVGGDGRFEIPEVLAGDFTARLQHGKAPLVLYGSASGTVEPDRETEIRVALQPSGEIRGTVFRPAATPEGKRPAFGAEVTIELVKGGKIPLLAQEDGSFSAKGVPLGAFSVRVFDPMSDGRAYRPGRSLGASDRCGQDVGTCHDEGEILIDDEPPALAFVQPVPGSTRLPFGGLLVIDAADDVDPSSMVVRYSNGYSQGAGQFTFENGRFSGTLYAPAVKLGANRLTVSAKDTSGNVGDAEVTFTVLGGTVRGQVIAADGTAAPAGVPVKLGSVDLVTDADGRYLQDGLRAGPYTAHATDPLTGLESPPMSGPLPDGGDLVLDDLRLPAAGSIAGTVVRSDTTTGAGAGLSVDVGGRTYTTGADGSFATAALLPDTYVVEVRSPNGDRGRKSVVVDAGAPTPATVVLNGVGSAKVTVLKADGSAAVGATVTIDSSAGFPDPDKATTNGSGEAVFPLVFAGTVSAMAEYRGLESSAPAQVLPDGGHRDFTITLEPAARVAGHVRSATGDAVVGATVLLTGPRAEQTTSGAEGAYEFTEVPLGPFTVEASTPDGDRGLETGVLAADPPPVDITLAGFGDLVVLVRDTADAPIQGAGVTVVSVKFGLLGSKVTDEEGRAAFPHIRAGELDLSVQAQGQKAERRVTLPAGGSLTETIQVGAKGAVSGTVRAPGSEDGVEGVQVTVAGRSTVTGAGGTYTVEDVTPGSYTVDARVNGRLRARQLVQVRSGETADGSVELVGVGTIRGFVRHEGAAVEGASVETNVAGTLGGTFAAQSGPDGTYALSDVPVQAFLLTVTAREGDLSADGRVRIEYHGQEIPLDFDLLPNAVAVPRTLSDGNKVPWRVQPDGSLAQSYVFEFSPTPTTGGPHLSLVRGLEEAAFVGRGQPGLEATEDGQRETVLRQEGLLGLRVTRKVFVPSDGYFVRFLEVLENDGEAPVTVDLVLKTVLTDRWGLSYGAGAPQILPQGSPRFVVVDDAVSAEFYLTPWQTGQQLPPLGVAFGGSEGQAPAVALSGYELTYRWTGVEVPAKGSAAVMHVWTSQSDRTRAEASGERLAGLPPEVLAGLSAAEAEAVRNFAVPADLQSALPALPPNDGLVTLRVRAGDGQTPVPAVAPAFRSRSPHYGHPLSTTAANPYSADGSFKLAATATDLVPRTAFDLTTQVSDFGGVSATARGAFPSSGVVELSAADGRTLLASSSASSSYAPTKAFDFDLATAWHASADDSLDRGRTPWLEVAFPAPVTVHRVAVRGSRSGGGFASRARLELVDALGQAVGSVESLDLPAPEHDADVVLPSPVAGVARVRFVALEGSGSPALAEMQVFGEGTLGAVRRADVDVVFQATGIVDVRVARDDGTALSGYSVLLSRGATSASRPTDSEGKARFLVVPEGSGWKITATHPRGGASVTRTNVTVASGPAAPEIELRFPAFGSVSGTPLSYAGFAVPGTIVLSSAAGYTRTIVTSSQLPSFEFTDVPVGTYTLKGTDHLRTQAVVTTPSFPVAAGPNTAPGIVFPAVGTIRVTTTSGGQVYAGARVRWRSLSSGIDWKGPYSTDGGGKLTLSNVAGPTVDLEVSRPDLPLAPVTRTVSIPEELAQLDETFDLPSTTSLAGALRSLDGVPYPSRTVEAWNEAGTARIAQATTSASGAFSVSVPPGIVWLRAAGDCGTWGEVRVDLAVTATADALLPRGTIARAGQKHFWEFSLGATRYLYLHADGVANGSAAPIPEGSVQAYRSDATAVLVDRQSVELAAGRYLLAAGGRDGATGGYRVCNSYGSGLGLRPWGGPWARGEARKGGVPLVGYRVRLVRPALPALETATDDSGGFALPLIVPGDFGVEVVDSAGVVIGRATGTAEPETDVVLAPIDVPDRAAVTVLVRRAGSGIGGVAVTLTSDNPDALPEDAHRVVTTGEDGRASALVPAGTVTAVLDPIATACDKGPEGASACTDTRPTPADFTFTLPDLPTTVIVRVTALDGLTPLPSAWAEVVGASGAAAVDADGVVVFPGIPAGRRVVRAWAGGREVFQDADLSGGEATVAVALPVPAIRATLADSHGADVTGGTVQACGTEERQYCSGYPWYYCYTYHEHTCVAAPASSGGVYVFDQLTRWVSGYSVELTGRPTASNASAATSLSVEATSSTVYPVALQLPPTGKLHGAVVASDGVHRVPNANVWISTDGGDPVALAADGEGLFAAPYVLPGRITVHAEDPQDRVPGQEKVDVPADGDEAVQVMLVPSAVLTLHLGGQDWSGGVAVEAPEAPRRPGARAWRRTLVPSPNESMPVTVPAGFYRVFSPSSDYLSCDEAVAGAEGLVTDTADVSLSLGTHVVQPRPLEGAGGSYGGGGSCSTADPLVDTAAAGVEGYPRVGEPRPEGATGSDIRAVRTLSAVGNGLRVRREQFVPASGAFGRTTTFLANPGPERTTTLASGLALPRGSWTIATTSNGDATLDSYDTWAVLDDGGGRPMGLILGTGLGRTGGLHEQVQCGAEVGCWTEYRFDVSETLPVPASGTVAFTTFSLVRSGTPEDLALEIEALLEDEAVAFEGLSPEERAEIANMPPPGPPTGVSGAVKGPSGEVVPQAIVGVLRDGFLVARKQADESGQFTVKALVPGPVTVIALDPQTNRPGRLDATVTAGAVEALGDLFLLPDTALGRVDAHVEYEDGGGAAGETLDVRADGFGELWHATIVAGADGRGSADAVPAGIVTLRWAGTDESREVSGELPPLGVLPMQLTIPVSAESVDAPTLLGVASGPPFLVDGDGSVWSGDYTCTPFCGSWAAVDGDGYGWEPLLSLVRHREVVTPPEEKSGLQVARRTFVPFSGTYVRLIDVISNPASDDRVVRYQLSSSFEAAAGAWVVATTSNGDAEFTAGDAFAVVRNADSGQTAAIVRAGPSSTAPPDEPVWDDAAQTVASDTSVWTALRVPAGGTVRLMQFLVTVPDGPTSVEDARALAQSLADLTEPTALFGLSTAERATILNFGGPGNP